MDLQGLVLSKDVVRERGGVQSRKRGDVHEGMDDVHNRKRSDAPSRKRSDVHKGMDDVHEEMGDVHEGMG